jgi:hypothetical protein
VTAIKAAGRARRSNKDPPKKDLRMTMCVGV